MSQPPERRKLVEEIFLLAVDAPAEARDAVLRERCGDDHALRRDVESLLRQDVAETISVLRTPMIGGGTSHRLGEQVGDVIGRYTLVEVVGEGGFGIVYRARQSQPVQRDVALKVIKAGMDTRQVVSRFEAERQALAMMDHPNVARVLDGGATDASLGGRPYFVMEFVTGRPITDFCDQARLGVEERLAIFQQVCSAVQHAHQKGILHRDLKPSNVLVQDVDGRAVVKVIDFGIAKAIGPSAEGVTMMTEAGQYIGTPEYMSPEQATGGVVDTRADIYSLGVILYEILAGALPIDLSEMRRAGFVAMQRAINQSTPVRPSTRVRTGGPEIPQVASFRRADAAALHRRLKGDLDWIVMKALEKEPERRYASVSELSQDLVRHVQHEAVMAGPPGVGYRARKFVRRNRVGVVAVAIVALAMMGGAIATSIGFARAVAAEGLARQRAEAEAVARSAAERRFGQVRELATALTHDIHDAVRDIPGSTEARRKIVEFGMKYADSLVEDVQGDPDLTVEVAAAYRRLADVLGKPSTANLGDGSGALEAYRKAFTLLEPIFAALPATSPGLIELREAIFGEAILLRSMGRTPEAIEVLRRGGPLLERLLAAQPQNYQRKNDVETLYANVARMQEAVGEYEEALQGYRRYLAFLVNTVEHEEEIAPWLRLSNIATIHLPLGELMRKMGRKEEAVDVFKQGVEWAQKAIEVNPTSLRLKGSLAESNRLLGYTLLDVGRPEEAAAPLQESASIWRSVAAADPKDARAARNRAIAEYSLGYLAKTRGDAETALRHYEKYAELIEKVAADNPDYAVARRDVAIARQSVGEAYSDLGRYAEALESHRKALSRYETLLAGDPNDVQAHADVVDATRLVVAMMHTLSGQKPESERVSLKTQAAAMLDRARELLRSLEDSGRGSGQVEALRGGIEEVWARWQNPVPAQPPPQAPDGASAAS